MLPDLWAHQREAKAVRLDEFCLFFDTGTGKTRTALEFLRDTCAQKGFVIAPINVCRNWVDEVNKFIPGGVKTFMIAGDLSVDKKKAVIESFAKCKERSLLIVNTETLRLDNYMGLIRELPIDFLVIDEAHDFKNADSAQGKGLAKFVKTVRPKYIFPLTGTPTPQGEIDLYIYMLLTGEVSAPFFIWKKKHFIDVNNCEEKNEYMTRLHEYLTKQGMLKMDMRSWKSYLLKNIRSSPNPFRIIWDHLKEKGIVALDFVDWRLEMISRCKSYPKFELREESKGFFTGFLKKRTMTANKDECLDLPPYLRTIVWAEMDDAQKTAYRNMERDFYVELDSGIITASNVLARMTRLQQITAGFIRDEHLSDARLKAFEYAVDSIGKESFVAWTIMEPTYHQLAKVLDSRGIDYGMIIGEVKPEMRKKMMDMLQEKKIQALIAHPKAGGVGVNLTSASYSIHYTKNFDLVLDMQAAGRTYRGGSEIHKKITRIDILAPNTIDVRIHDALLDKEDVQSFILNFKKRSQTDVSAYN